MRSRHTLDPSVATSRTGMVCLLAVLWLSAAGAFAQSTPETTAPPPTQPVVPAAPPAPAEPPPPAPAEETQGDDAESPAAIPPAPGGAVYPVPPPSTAPAPAPDAPMYPAAPEGQWQQPGYPGSQGDYVDPYAADYYGAPPVRKRKARDRWTKHDNALYIDPLAFLVGLLNAEYERALADRASLFFGPQALLGFGAALDVFGVGARFGPRIFALGRAPEGLWVAPEVQLLWATDKDVDAFIWGTGGMLGYSAIWGHFGLSVGLGVSYLRYSNDIAEDDSVLLPSLRLSIGAAFGDGE